MSADYKHYKRRQQQQEQLDRPLSRKAITSVIVSGVCVCVCVFLRQAVPPNLMIIFANDEEGEGEGDGEEDGEMQRVVPSQYESHS